MIPATFARETRYFAPPANRGMSHLAPDRSTASQRLSGRQRLPSLRSGTLKKWLQAGIRSLHVAFATQPLPDRVALAFHELEADQHDAFRRAIGYFLERELRLEDLAWPCDPLDIGQRKVAVAVAADLMAGAIQGDEFASRQCRPFRTTVVDAAKVRLDLLLRGAIAEDARVDEKCSANAEFVEQREGIVPAAVIVVERDP